MVCRTRVISCSVKFIVRFAKQFHGTMLQCLDSTNIGIVESSLKNLAEFAVLSQGSSFPHLCTM